MVRDDDLNELYKVLQLNNNDNLIYFSHLFLKLAEAGRSNVNVLLKKFTPEIEAQHGGP